MERFHYGNFIEGKDIQNLLNGHIALKSVYWMNKCLDSKDTYSNRIFLDWWYHKSQYSYSGCSSVAIDVENPWKINGRVLLIVLSQQRLNTSRSRSPDLLDVGKIYSLTWIGAVILTTIYCHREWGNLTVSSNIFKQTRWQYSPANELQRPCLIWT
jgi:hypothetical protein